jgi:hypothetical protein
MVSPGGNSGGDNRIVGTFHFERIIFEICRRNLFNNGDHAL